MCVRKSYFAYTRKGRISGPVRETAKIARKFIRLNKTNVRKNKIGSYNYLFFFFSIQPSAVFDEFFFVRLRENICHSL